MKYMDFINFFILVGFVAAIALFIILLIVLLALLSTIIIEKNWPVVVKWFRWKIKEKKYIGLFLIILSLLSIGLYQVFRPRNIEFTQITAEETCVPVGLRIDNSWYEEIVLVKNMPKNTLKQSKIMIAYFDSIGFGINALSEMPEIAVYTMDFYKSTRITRRYLTEPGKYCATNQPVTAAALHRSINGDKTYFGSVLISRCEDNADKFRVEVSRNIGRYDNFEYRTLGPVTGVTMLLDECSSKWLKSRTNKELDSILAEYYMDLQNKKLVKH